MAEREGDKTNRAQGGTSRCKLMSCTIRYTSSQAKRSLYKEEEKMKDMLCICFSGTGRIDGWRIDGWLAGCEMKICKLDGGTENVLTNVNSGCRMKLTSVSCVADLKVNLWYDEGNR